MADVLPLTRVAYHAQQTAIRVSLVAAHLGLRPFVPARRRPSEQELGRLRARLSELLAHDLANVAEGLYPEELLFSFPLREYLSGLPGLALEVARMLSRKRLGKVRDLPSDVALDRYPVYFRRNFHWQTDGYLSHRSAKLYDLGVEFLFLGTADVMRRQALAPLSRFVQARIGRQRILDVACGTGRFLRQLTTALPGHRFDGLDLSPFYIARAREQLAGKAVSLSVGNAEELPFSEGTFDATTSIFLFHELPRRARMNALAEMRRVLAPGGLLVLEDAAQLSDSPELRVFLENFGRDMNEPFFHDYLHWDLPAALAESGFSLERVEPAFLSKVVVARAR
jgi:ubiquinone/menaquinone biosynthesis C-methylase UbiE